MRSIIEIIEPSKLRKFYSITKAVIVYILISILAILFYQFISKARVHLKTNVREKTLISIYKLDSGRKTALVENRETQNLDYRLATGLYQFIVTIKSAHELDDPAEELVFAQKTQQIDNWRKYTIELNPDIPKVNSLPLDNSPTTIKESGDYISMLGEGGNISLYSSKKNAVDFIKSTDGGVAPVTGISGQCWYKGRLIFLNRDFSFMKYDPQSNTLSSSIYEDDIDGTFPNLRKENELDQDGIDDDSLLLCDSSGVAVYGSQSLEESNENLTLNSRKVAKIKPKDNRTGILQSSGTIFRYFSTTTNQLEYDHGRNKPPETDSSQKSVRLYKQGLFNDPENVQLDEAFSILSMNDSQICTSSDVEVNKQIVCYDKNGKNKRKLVDTEGAVTNMLISNNMLYFTVDKTLYTISLSGGETKTLASSFYVITPDALLFSQSMNRLVFTGRYYQGQRGETKNRLFFVEAS